MLPRQRHLTPGSIDDQPHGAARVVQDQVDHGAGEGRTSELLGGDEELAGEPGPVLIRGERRRHGEDQQDDHEPTHDEKEDLIERTSLVTRTFFKIGASGIFVVVRQLAARSLLG